MLENAQLMSVKQAIALAADEGDNPEAGLAALRAQHQARRSTVSIITSHTVQKSDRDPFRGDTLLGLPGPLRCR